MKISREDTVKHEGAQRKNKKIRVIRGFFFSSPLGDGHPGE
jgi:hypothetical protein